MAGRRITLATRAAAVATVALATAAVAAPGPLVVSQVDMNSSIPFGRRTDSGGAKFHQKIAQTVTAPEGARKLASIGLVLAGRETHAVLRIYEVGENPPFGTLLKKVVIPVDASWGPIAEWQTARLRPALEVTPGKQYGLVLRVQERRRSLAAAGGGGYDGGERWCFCPVLKGGDPDFENARWQSAEELGTTESDLAFKLRFWRKG